MEVAETILQRYPDYGKTPLEYKAAVSEALAVYPRHIRHRIADIAEGITALCKFPPSVAEIIEMGNRMIDVERHSTAIGKRYAHVRAEPEPLTNYNPFPKLTAAFAAEPHLLKHGKITFDVLFDASRALAVSGIEAARSILASSHKGAATEQNLDGLRPFKTEIDNDTESRKAFIKNLNLEEVFPHGSHRTARPVRVKYDGPATEAALYGKSKFATGKPFPEHLMHVGKDPDHDS